jgi:hypothetical protein
VTHQTPAGTATEDVLVRRRDGRRWELVHGVVAPIPDVRSYYAVDVSGNVYMQIGSVLAPFVPNHVVRIVEAMKIQRSHNGYAQVKLTTDYGYTGRRKWFKVGATVLRLWMGAPPSPKHHCAHEDGDQKNNHVVNLAWKLQPDNEADKKRHGTRVGARPGHRKLTMKRKLAILEMYVRTGKGFGLSFTRIAMRFHVHRSTVARVVDHKASPICGGAPTCPLCAFIDHERGALPPGKYTLTTDRIRSTPSGVVVTGRIVGGPHAGRKVSVEG